MIDALRYTYDDNSIVQLHTQNEYFCFWLRHSWLIKLCHVLACLKLTTGRHYFAHTAGFLAPNFERTIICISVSSRWSNKNARIPAENHKNCSRLMNHHNIFSVKNPPPVISHEKSFSPMMIYDFCVMENRFFIIGILIKTSL